MDDGGHLAVRHLELVAALLRARRARLHGFLDDRFERDRFASQLELAGVEARDVEQIVDEARDVMDLALDDAANPRGDRRIRIVLEDFDGGLQRLQRIAQLVREDREELVLAAIDLGHLLHLLLEDFSLEALALREQLALVRARLFLPELLGFLLQLDGALLQLHEHECLRAQHLGPDRLHEEVERAELVALQHRIVLP